MIVKLLTEHHLEFLSIKERCRGSSESTHVKCHIVGNLMYWLIFLADKKPHVSGFLEVTDPANQKLRYIPVPG